MGNINKSKYNIEEKIDELPQKIDKFKSKDTFQQVDLKTNNESKKINNISQNQKHIDAFDEVSEEYVSDKVEKLEMSEVNIKENIGFEINNVSQKLDNIYSNKKNIYF